MRIAVSRTGHSRLFDATLRRAQLLLGCVVPYPLVSPPLYVPFMGDDQGRKPASRPRQELHYVGQPAADPRKAAVLVPVILAPRLPWPDHLDIAVHFCLLGLAPSQSPPPSFGCREERSGHCTIPQIFARQLCRFDGVSAGDLRVPSRGAAMRPTGRLRRSAAAPCPRARSTVRRHSRSRRARHRIAATTPRPDRDRE
jgi:hypothetical protein